MVKMFIKLEELINMYFILNITIKVYSLPCFSNHQLLSSCFQKKIILINIQINIVYTKVK